MLDEAVNAILAVPFPGVAVPIVGALGTVAGVTLTLLDAGPFPSEFVADTLHAYSVPFVSPLTTTGLAEFVPVVVTLAAVQDAVYPVIADPPSEAGAVNAMLALPLPRVATPIVGGPGTVGPDVGVTCAPPDASLVPSALEAVTLHVYVVPFVRPVTTIGLEAPVAVFVVAPVAEQDAVYCVIAAVPESAGAVNVTVAVPFPGVAAPIVGAPGGVPLGPVAFFSPHALSAATTRDKEKARRDHLAPLRGMRLACDIKLVRRGIRSCVNS